MKRPDEHETLAKMWNARAFEPQIHYIRFPRFRNLEDGLRIDFGHPITAIVGPNGTNKSSILRALQGCPDYENIGKYWFGTAIDVIPPDERHRFIHGRWSQSSQQVVEVLKTRIRRKDSLSKSNPDYFEPSRPIVRDGMTPMPDSSSGLPDDRTETRWKAIDKPVVYLDFRAEISAFDKYFYHHEYRPRQADRKNPQRKTTYGDVKALIKERSPRVKRLLDERTQSYKPGGKEWVISAGRSLSAGELEAVGSILGRTYAGIEVLSHRAFEVAGVTARLRTANYAYSEAWAGSGEFAVIQLVTAIENAAEKSLVLLDEPEVSLHPGAQRRLLDYLASRAKARFLQIVLATHSPVILEALPPQAIKVLEVVPTTGRVAIRSQSSSSAEAFVAIEHVFDKPSVLVEDVLAREIVLRALRTGGALLVDSVNIAVVPGGADTILSRMIPSFAATNRSNVLVYLDGDKSREVLEPDSVATDGLSKAVEKTLGVKSASGVVFANSGGPTEEQLKGILAWFSRSVRFLPGEQPDKWLRGKLGEELNGVDEKDYWRIRTRQSLQKMGSEDAVSLEILEEQKRALLSIDGDDADLSAIRETVRKLLQVGTA